MHHEMWNIPRVSLERTHLLFEWILLPASELMRFTESLNLFGDYQSLCNLSPKYFENDTKTKNLINEIQSSSTL